MDRPDRQRLHERHGQRFSSVGTTGNDLSGGYTTTASDNSSLSQSSNDTDGSLSAGSGVTQLAGDSSTTMGNSVLGSYTTTTNATLLQISGDSLNEPASTTATV